MKIVQINTVPNGSTGSIMMSIHKSLQKDGVESYVVWGRGRKSKDKYEIYLNDKIGVYLHVLYSRITGKSGFASKRSTKKLIKKLDLIKPDIIHLHNIHGYYINIEMLFNYIKSNNIKTVWTLHDCWAFTGHCSHFQYAKCEKWKKQCMKCPQKNSYPRTIFDNSKWCYLRKKNIFTSVKDLTIISPSVWLANLIKKSFLKDYNIQVINNGINTKIFKILDKGKLSFRKKYNLENKTIILGVASPWTEEKGIKDFIELSKKMDEKYKIVLVGLNNKQLKDIPSNILGLIRTNNVEELVDIYNSADVFVNPTYADNYPTTNLEAIVCGTPVITYDTGGSHESAFLNENSLNYIIKSNLEENVEQIKKIIQENNFNYITNLNVNMLDKSIMIKKYKDVYISNNSIGGKEIGKKKNKL